jgi:GT2 family glycosyltransferase
MPLATVIVPFYNQLRFLDQCLRSILSQSLRDVELIVVDDGSAEDPTEVIQRLNDTRVKFVRRPNGGVALARNSALELVASEFVSFVDADDWLAPTMLQRLIEKLAQQPEAGMAYCDIHRVNEAGELADTHRISGCRPRLSGGILPSLLVGGYFPPASVVVRASVLDAVGGFDPALGGCCDWDLWIRIAATGYGAVFHDEQLAYYRRHDLSMSQDLHHMRAAATQALSKNMSRYPAQMAEACECLIQTSEAIYAANQEARLEIQQLRLAIDERDVRLAEFLTGKNWLERQWQALLHELRLMQQHLDDKDKAYKEQQDGKDWLERKWRVLSDEIAGRDATIQSLLSAISNEKKTDEPDNTSSNCHAVS